MRTDYGRKRRRWVERKRFVCYRDRSIELARGRVRDRENIEGVRVPAERQRHGPLRKAHGFGGITYGRVRSRGVNRRQAGQGSHPVGIQFQRAPESRDRFRKVLERARNQTDVQVGFRQLRIDACGFAERCDCGLRPSQLKKRGSEVVLGDGIRWPQRKRAFVLGDGLFEAAGTGERGPVVEVGGR